MGIAALVLWLLTAVGGFVLLGTWIAKGGAHQPTNSHLPPAVVFGHFLLAVVGLILWIIYLAVDTRALAWISFVLLLLVAVLGLGMFVRWLPVYRARVEVDSGPLTATSPPAERNFPVMIVAGHGVFAVTTVVLVFLAALGVGS
ncbi:hypothetical protein [Nocardia stercoris]|uniref:DUF2269 family protein n=1 Tax=Nocardia stercoris TaxID=2483361 RepID=A0A3M2L2Y4_9NOCA|nr:hypothetical protein [Nocardia stercoris]RMI31336.1 hypothetical protein EBN03_18420 [Nocardia stercoris]